MTASFSLFKIVDPILFCRTFSLFSPLLGFLMCMSLFCLQSVGCLICFIEIPHYSLLPNDAFTLGLGPLKAGPRYFLVLLP